MRIGFVADKLNISQGGSNFSLDLMAQSLSGRGHEVTVLTVNFNHENDLPTDPAYEVFESPLGDGSRVADARGVYQRLAEHDDRFDVYHVFNPALHPVAGAYRRRHDTPVVGRLNNYDIFCTNLSMMDGECHERCTVGRKFAHDDREPSGKIANLPKYTFDTYGLPRLLSEMDRLFALSPQVDQIYQDIGVDPETIAVVPNFYDSSFGGASDEEVKFSGDRNVLYVGTLKSHKGVDLLVESAPELPAGTGVEIVGAGPERDSLAARAAELGVEDAVTFHGWVDNDELAPYYRGADVFVHPGLWPEPFNRTLLEAMQCDCPLVVSDIGAPPWVVEGCGLAFDRGDAADLSAQLRRLLTDEARRSELAWGCVERLETFSPERSVSLLETAYDELVS
jgi:glycosyltransferase involved in cell wall biosynthesis